MAHRNELDTLARDIVRQHSHLALQADALERLPVFLAALPAAITELIPRAVYAACRALDFIDIDAQCVTSAWQRQSERTGQFDASAWPTEAQDFGLTLSSRTRSGIQEVQKSWIADQARNDIQINSFPPCPPQLDLYAVLPDAACRALDLIDIDAQCVSSAWQRQSERTGQFDASTWPTEPQDFGLHTLPVIEDHLARHCERSAAIQDSGLHGLPRRDAPRDDEMTAVMASEARQSMNFPPCPPQLDLYAVLPDAVWVGRMARAGVPTVQLRFKSDDPAAIRREVTAAVQAVQGTNALLFINDHWQAAIEAGAYGVHLGQEDLEGLGGADLNAIRSAGLRLGVSSHGYAEMLRAARVQPSYIAMGAVYATTLKRMVTPPQGPARLKVYAALLRHMPTVAIGGIDAARLPEVLASGVGAVAVVRALVAADHPEAQVAALQAMF